MNLPKSLFAVLTRGKAVSLFLLLAAGVHAENWPQFRGPQGIGVSPEKNLPLHWNRTNHVRWKTPLPDRGNATPAVWENRIFVNQAIEKEGRRELFCFDRATGKKLWSAGVTYLKKEPTHEINPYCSASPATDGERVLASFGSAGLYCYDFDGKEVWHRDLGEQIHIWGNGASPIIYRDLAILNVGPGERTFLIALNKRTGETVWQINEPGGASGIDLPGKPKSDWIGSWSTPIITDINDRPELIFSFPKRVVGLDPRTGKELWSCSGLNPLVYTSPLFADGVVVAMGGYGGAAVAFKPSGAGDLTKKNTLWLTPKNKQRIGSGVISDGHIYVLDQPGVAECIELKTGKVVWEERLASPSNRFTSWSSAVLTGDKLVYAINEAGETFVLKASPAFKMEAVNALDERTLSSLAVSHGEIFIRTYKNLWCISSATPEVTSR